MCHSLFCHELSARWQAFSLQLRSRSSLYSAPGNFLMITQFSQVWFWAFHSVCHAVLVEKDSVSARAFVAELLSAAWSPLKRAQCAKKRTMSEHHASTEELLVVSTIRDYVPLMVSAVPKVSFAVQCYAGFQRWLDHTKYSAFLAGCSIDDKCTLSSSLGLRSVYSSQWCNHTVDIEP